MEMQKVEEIQQKAQEVIVPKRKRNIRLEFVQLSLTIFTATFVVLSFLANRVPYFTVDLNITHAIQRIHNLPFEYIMRFVSSLGYFPQAYFVVGGIVALIYILGLKWEGTVALINASTISLITFVLKTLVHRPRPGVDLVNVFHHLGEFSFPSGHVMFYTSFYGYLFFISFVLLKRSASRTFLLLFLALLVLLVGPSRVYLGEHWASDVFGAYLFGTIWLVVMIYLYDWGKKRFFVHQPTAPEVKK